MIDTKPNYLREWVKDIVKQGEIAARAGQSRLECPYSNALQVGKYCAWMAGYNDFIGGN